MCTPSEGLGGDYSRYTVAPYTHQKHHIESKPETWNDQEIFLSTGQSESRDIV